MPVTTYEEFEEIDIFVALTNKKTPKVKNDNRSKRVLQKACDELIKGK